LKSLDFTEQNALASELKSKAGLAIADRPLLIAGVDEAGRGPLAGPVAAAACILPEGLVIEGLNDSKKLSEKKREALFDQICEKAAAFCIASATVEEIDRLNILEATLLAMRQAVEGLPLVPDVLLIYGNVRRSFDKPARAVIGGDAKCPSIAAASILAKVWRDRYCAELDAKYPAYGFAAHKGYGTKQHIEALRAHGATPDHRALFVRKFV